MNGSRPILSDNARDRGKDRAGLDRAAVERTACKALANGVRAAETSGSLRRYLDFMGIEFKTTPIIHGNHVWVFGAENVLVTVIELPHEHRRSAASALAKRSKGGVA